VYDAARRWAEQFVNGPTFALRAAKESIDQGLSVDLETGLAIEAQKFAALFATEDRTIGMQSFIDKGPGNAEFTGR
jgi:enoyl-CoA hydratase